MIDNTPIPLEQRLRSDQMRRLLITCLNGGSSDAFNDIAALLAIQANVPLAAAADAFESFTDEMSCANPKKAALAHACGVMFLQGQLDLVGIDSAGRLLWSGSDTLQTEGLG